VIKKITLICLLVGVVALFTATNAVSHPNPQCSMLETKSSQIETEEGMTNRMVNDISPPMADITNLIIATSPCDATSMPAFAPTVVAIYNVSGRELHNYDKDQMSGANGQENQTNATAAVFAKAVSSTTLCISADNPLETSVQEVTPVAEIAVKSEETFSFRPITNYVLPLTRPINLPTMNVTVTVCWLTNEVRS
jgi:hypothetical protein